jgi:signal peptidase I
MNLPLILFLLTLITGVVYFGDRLIWGKKREAEAPVPWWIETGRSIFPVIFIVFFLRSFVVEPFRIPSSSMRPGLEVGDFILVNKFRFGIRLPILERKIIDVSSPERGEVVVFRFPQDPSVDYIKRIVGLPGDVIEFHNRRLMINGTEVVATPAGMVNYFERRIGVDHVTVNAYQVSLGERSFVVLHDLNRPPLDLQVQGPEVIDRSCEIVSTRVRCTVPPGQYFVMGDNRDNSQDSRVWGFVPDDHLRGNAIAIWFNFSFDNSPVVNFRRIGLVH